MGATTIAVDLAKSIFEVAVSDRPGNVAENHRLSRDRMMRFFAQREEATVVFEACGTAHYWGRQLQSLGGPKEGMDPMVETRLVASRRL